MYPLRLSYCSGTDYELYRLYLERSVDIFILSFIVSHFIFRHEHVFENLYPKLLFPFFPVLLLFTYFRNHNYCIIL